MDWLTYPLGLPLLVPLLASVALIVRAFMLHRTVKARERAKTERLRHLLRDCTPAERAKILRALRGVRDTRP